MLLELMTLCDIMGRRTTVENVTGYQTIGTLPPMYKEFPCVKGTTQDLKSWGNGGGGICRSSDQNAFMEGNCGDRRWFSTIGSSLSTPNGNRDNLPAVCGVQWGSWTELYICPVGQCT